MENVHKLLEQFGLIGNIAILLVSLVVLVFASNFTIKHTIRISDMTGIGKTTVGFVLVGLSTSLANLSALLTFLYAIFLVVSFGAYQV